MILANGVDLETIQRFEQYRSAKDPLIKKVFTAAEANYCFGQANPAESLAARFAAKEAIVKAFGGLEISLKVADVEIIKQNNGSVKAKIRGPKLGKYEIAVSLAHAENFAIAFCIVSQNKTEED